MTDREKLAVFVFGWTPVEDSSVTDANCYRYSDGSLIWVRDGEWVYGSPEAWPVFDQWIESWGWIRTMEDHIDHKGLTLHYLKQLYSLAMDRPATMWPDKTAVYITHRAPIELRVKAAVRVLEASHA